MADIPEKGDEIDVRRMGTVLGVTTYGGRTVLRYQDAKGTPYRVSYPLPAGTEVKVLKKYNPADDLAQKMYYRHRVFKGGLGWESLPHDDKDYWRTQAQAAIKFATEGGHG